MVKHIWYDCEKDNYKHHSEGNCMFCDGGLASCVVCNGAEGSLTTECCGYKLDEKTQDKIYKEGLDFKDGKWYYK